MRATDLGGVGVLKHDRLVLLTDATGDIHPDTRGLGLYQADTRVLSAWALRVNGARPTVLRSDTGGTDEGAIQLTNPEVRRDLEDKIEPEKVLERRSLSISRHRRLGQAFHERLTIVNHALHDERITIDLVVDADSADIFEVRGSHRPARGETLPIAIREDRAAFAYRGLDGLIRRTHVAVPPSYDAAPAPDDPMNPGAVRFRWRRMLKPAEHVSLELLVWCELSETEADDPFPVLPVIEPAPDHERPPLSWNERAASIDSDNELFDRLVERGLSDLTLLTCRGPDPGERFVAAGVPWFTTLFGRDSIIAAYEALPFRPEIADAVLSVLASRQAVRDDPWRDAQPGKILHELRDGEMARTGELPYDAYFGSVDATPLWLILLGETHDWSGDDALVERLWPNAMAALNWLDEYGDSDGDGFVDYRRRSERGLVNQGWKDSGDGVRDRHGKMLEAPIALAEVQGYVFDAKRRIARLARRRGDEVLAGRLEREAAELQARFEAAFWVEDRQTYAMALGKGGACGDALTSNMGHCLWSGIVSPERAPAVVRHLTGPALDSGWGIRTLAAAEAGFTPLGYHTGSVWPHDTAIAAAGLDRYGHDTEADDLARRLFEAALTFPDIRLPELFCGFARSEIDVPVPYPVACTPQAWAAAAPLLLLRTMLGLSADAAARTLTLSKPHLPPWLARVTVRELAVGDASVDLLVHRWRGLTSAEVLRKSGDVDVTIRV
ncbi:MAG: amylo-alpha-1,6-glucosidase [Chloroflexi bacterium]|nr:amylo-alpha-1,6-glucosidase [Chloroflexota bacterium]